MSNAFATISQLVIAFGIYNVWLVRANKPTGYRGGDAKTLEEEFHVYGLSTGFMKLVKVLKLSCASLLILGVWFPMLSYLGALGMGVLMLAAVLMHMKVRDPIGKALPAASLLVLSLVVAISAGTR